MCGIIGYMGPKPAYDILIDGLRKLEYRGYDSAGIAVLNNGAFDVRRAKGKLDELLTRISDDKPLGNQGIGHTRWATHGRPSDDNAHPHQAGDIVLIHNGIIENYLELKAELLEAGCRFASETDTEVVAHLINTIYQSGGDFLEAVNQALARLRGSWGLLIMNLKEPGTIIAARKDSPLIAGIGDGEYFFASDVPAFLSHTNRVVFLNDGEVAMMDKDGIKVFDPDRRERPAPETTIDWSPVMAEKAGYKHFMLKEIFEQPRAIIDTFRGRIQPDEGLIRLDELGLSDQELKGFAKIFVVACGTSWHAGLVAKFMIEGLAKVPVEVDLASEFRYRNPIVDRTSLVIFISQSGETMDTMGALRTAKAKGARVVTICNVLGSTMTRESDGVLYTHAGPEIGVASTKAFTTQLTALYLFALHLGFLRGQVDRNRLRQMIDDLVQLPGLVEKALELDEDIHRVARTFSQADDFLFLARGLNYPIALEGALKLKEISYIHAEGYPAGEMKHGPIALIDENMPVVCLVPSDASREKILSNMQEVTAREGRLIAVVTNREDCRQVEARLVAPNAAEYLSPIVLSVPLQLLAYHIAVIRGTDVDQPRNLAKSVTVE